MRKCGCFNNRNVRLDEDLIARCTYCSGIVENVDFAWDFSKRKYVQTKFCASAA